MAPKLAFARNTGLVAPALFEAVFRKSFLSGGNTGGGCWISCLIYVFNVFIFVGEVLLSVS